MSYSYNKYHGIDQVFMAIINKKARSLIRAGFFCGHQLEDLQQEFLIQTLERIDKYQPNQGTIYGFVKKVVNSCACDLIRAQKMQYVDMDVQLHDSCDEAFSDAELHLDLEIMFADSGDPDLLIIFELSQIMDVAQVSKITGKSMKTIYRKLAKIREIIACE
ncbi:MAG: hypothetical protein DGJ47_000345 [Rickettsiaceae bacterium]